LDGYDSKLTNDVLEDDDDFDVRVIVGAKN